MADARELYDQDFNLWAQETAAALRAGRWVAVDVEHVAEEIEDLAKCNKRELQSRLTQILEHLLKLRLEKGTILDYNRGGWQASIRRQRAEIESVLEESPSLRQLIDQELIERCYQNAAGIVPAEYGIQPPAQCPFQREDLL